MFSFPPEFLRGLLSLLLVLVAASDLTGLGHPFQGQQESATKAEADVEAVMARAMMQANRGEFLAATQAVGPLWRRSADPHVGVSLLQLLEQAAAEAARAGTPGQWIQLERESGTVARQLLHQKTEDPAARRIAAAAIWRESEMLAGQGDPEAAFRSLAEAFEAGWFRFDEALASESFRKLGHPDRLACLVSDARARLMVQFRSEEQKSLALFQSFPFELETEDIDGHHLSLQSLRGRIVLLHFWGTWCPICCKQLPDLVKLEQVHEKQVELVGLSFENAEIEKATDLVRESRQKIGGELRCAVGDRSWLEQVPDFAGFPTLIVLDATGRVRARLTGDHPVERVEAIVRLLLDEEASAPGSPVSPPIRGLLPTHPD